MFLPSASKSGETSKSGSDVNVSLLSFIIGKVSSSKFKAVIPLLHSSDDA